MKTVLSLLVLFISTTFLLGAAALPEAQEKPQEISYTRFSQLVKEDRIKSLAIIRPGQGEIKTKGGKKFFFPYLVSETSFIDTLARRGVPVDLEKLRISSESSWARSVPFILLGFFVLAMILFYASGRHRQGGREKMKATKKKGSSNSVPGFSAVAGLRETVEEVAEFSQYLKNPDPFLRVGARMPRGLLLYGPPGTGKTLLAKALAAEAGVTFFAVAGTDFVEKYVGVGPSRVRDLFKKAGEESQGAVIFIDEIDAIGRKRSGGGEIGNDEREGTLNEILVQLDGFSEQSRVLVIGATNRMEILDEALLRPGRLARQIFVPLPDTQARQQILKLHARGKPLDSSVSLKRLAEMTAGSSGADLSEMLNEAAIMAARAGRETIKDCDLSEGQLRVLAGPERRGGLGDPLEKKTVAYHEAGHVLAAELSAEHERAERATIKPRGAAAGLALYGQRDRLLHSESYIEEQLVCILGGRAAEAVAFGHVSSGAANDLQRANHLARRAVEEWGLSPIMGQSAAHGSKDSEERLASLDKEVGRLVDDAYQKALLLLRENQDLLQSLAEALLEKEDLSRLDIEEALGQKSLRKTRKTPEKEEYNTAKELPLLEKKPFANNKKEGLVTRLGKMYNKQKATRKAFFR